MNILQQYFHILRKRFPFLFCVVCALETATTSSLTGSLYAQEQMMLKLLSFAPDTSHTQYAGLSVNFLTGEFTGNLGQFPGAPQTSTPTNTSLRGITLSFANDTRLFAAILPGVRFGFATEFQLVDGRFQAESSQMLTTDGVSRTVSVLHDGALSYQKLSFMPSFRYVTEGGLMLQTGINLGLLMRSIWNLTDSITTPDARFPNGQATRIASTLAPITGLNVSRVGAVFSAGLNIPIGRSLLVRPEATVEIPIPSAQDSTNSWIRNIPALRLGVSMLFNTTRQQTVIDTVYQRDTVVNVVASALAQQTLLINRSVESEGIADIDEPIRITVRESYRTDIPKPKPLMTASVRAEFASPDGKRQKAITIDAEKTAVRVFSTMRFLSPSDSLETTALLRRVAQALWGFDAQESKSIAVDSALRGTMLYADTVLTGQLPSVYFSPHIVSEAEVKRLHLSISQHKRTLAEFSSNAASGTGDGAMEFHWNTAAESELLIRADEVLAYALTVTDAENQEFVADSGAINIQKDFVNNPTSSRQSVKRWLDVCFLEVPPAMQDSSVLHSVNSILLQSIRRHYATAHQQQSVASVPTSRARIIVDDSAERLQSREAAAMQGYSLPYLSGYAWFVKSQLTLPQSSIIQRPLYNQINDPSLRDEMRAKKMREILSRILIVVVDQR